MMPIVNGLEDELGAQINVVRLNAAESDVVALQSQYGLRGHPSFAVLDEGGNVVERYFGPQSAETLREALQSALE